MNLFTKEEFIEEETNKLRILQAKAQQLEDAINKVASAPDCYVFIFDDPDYEDQFINYHIIEKHNHKRSNKQ